MAVRPIRIYGDPILREKARPVEETTAALRRLAEDMIDTMIEAEGIGLAAPQVGETVRMYVVNLGAIGPGLFRDRGGPSLEGDPDHLVLVNPRVVKREGAQTADEGCLSIPELYEKVTRPEVVRVEAADLDGRPLEIEGSGLLARVLVHEYDHLEGVLFIDHIGKLRQQFIRGKLRKLKESGQAV
ncbi:MAG: peptide deformylase [Gemmatimonadetes bacterium]|nr:peptide deformylase [Gemmatimonadota bacterium]